ncbi:methyltransferase domain-containing protein [Aquamicrobium segne]|uniref:Methyltransferase domain-containing protein n=1 Tax=Aquamicrobium segne TaxID=469547 RepID=A0ABW0H1D4_9HYPH
MCPDYFSQIDNYSSDPDKYLAVPFVPTEEDMVEVMLDLAEITARDLIYDLGSGDGRILIAAAKQRNARGIGIDIDPVRVGDAMEFAGWAGVELLVDFLEDDIFTADFSKATVVTLYLLQSVNVQLRPRLLNELRPGTRIISHAFDMGDWAPDDCRKIGNINIYKWIIPAKVEGNWQWEAAEGENWCFELEQKYQEVDARAWLNRQEVELTYADLCGNRLTMEFAENDISPTRKITLTFENGQIVSGRAENE